MSLPAGYKTWAESQGCSIYHPDEWSDGDRASFAAWKFDAFVKRMATFSAFDQWLLMGQAHTVSRIREWIDQLEAPPPSNPYKTCPCHPFRPRKAKPAGEPHGLSYLDSFRRKA